MKKATLEFAGQSFHRYYIQDKEEAKIAAKKLLAMPRKMMGLDLETGKKIDHPKAGLDPHMSYIRLCQIYDGKDVWVFERGCLNSLREVFYAKKWIAHYGIFELKHLTFAGFPNMDVHCSLLMGMLVDRAEYSPFEPSEEDEEDADGNSVYKRRGGYGLNNLVGKYFGVRIAKQQQTSDWDKKELTTEQINYAALDALLTFKLGEVCNPLIKKYKMQEAYALLQKMQYVICDMELNGIKLDEVEHRALMLEWMGHLEREERNTMVFFKDVNLNSSKQLNEWAREYFKLYEEMLEKWPKTPKGALTFNANALGAIAELQPIKHLLAYKKWYKLLTSYGEGLRDKINPVTGRIHCSFSLGETRTGRLSCREPNLQNMPRDGSMRHLFCAEGSNILVAADFSQIEMRVAGELSKDPVIRGAYEKGHDLHKVIVSAMTGKSIADVTKEERQMGKAINFGLLFGMGAKKLAHYARMSYGVKMSDEEAAKAWRTFHNTYKVYSEWCKKQRLRAEKQGWVRSVSGKIRKLGKDEMYTKAVNTPVQGGAAEVSFAALINCRARIQRLDTGIKIVNTVHDEILLETPVNRAKMAGSILKESMQFGMKTYFPDAPTEGLVEVMEGKTWQDVH